MCLICVYSISIKKKNHLSFVQVSHVEMPICEKKYIVVVFSKVWRRIYWNRNCINKSNLV